jgi:hypothetical protein
MLKQIDGSFALERNDVDTQRMQIVAEIRETLGVDESIKETKINEFNKNYKFRFSIDRRSLLSEYIRSTDKKKGPTLCDVNPWYFLERKTGFEPATPTLAMFCRGVS